VEFRILGPVEVIDAGRALPIGGAKQRALLSLLLLHANEYVSADRLMEDLWGDEADEGAGTRLRVAITRLRKALDAGPTRRVASPILMTRGHGYELCVRPGELDLEHFERLVAEGRAALAAGRPTQAAAQLREALGLWRGPPFADADSDVVPHSEIGRLEELRAAALEERIEADLALGRHDELIGELETVVAQHPLRERPRRQLVLALYRAGRQSEALAAYRGTRAMLMDELGLEPTSELRGLEQAILTHDPALGVEATSEVPTASRVPATFTSTIGREDDLRVVTRHLGRADVRLVTLTGPGGVGKTRLAIDVARAMEPQFEHGAWFVSLAQIERPEHLPSALAQALGVTPVAGETPQRAVERFLGPKHALVVLDNLEHLLAAAPTVTALLTESAALTVLATSREALRVEPEHRYEVSPLPGPTAPVPAEVEDAAASALFIDRARRRQPDFEVTTANAAAIADICVRLDGLPLAIELAAARTPMLSPEQLQGRLGRALDALGSGPRDAPARQRTIRATIDWSYQLLSPDEARAFAAFAVFRGGGTIEAAEEVTGAGLDTLTGLLDKHLLQRRHTDSADGRLFMLETVREYALGLLGEQALSEIRERHCRHYLGLVERAEPELNTHGEADWLPRLDAEVDNLRAAVDWSLTAGNPNLGLRLVGLLPLFWEIRGQHAEGVEWLDAALRRANDSAPIIDRARAERARLYLIGSYGGAYDPDVAVHKARAVEALTLARQTEDPRTIAEALLNLSDFESAQPFPQDRRRELAEEALEIAHEARDDRLIAEALTARAFALRFDEALIELDEAAAALRGIGATRRLAAMYSNATYNAIKAGVPHLAGPFVEQARPVLREIGHPVLLCIFHGNDGLQALFTGELNRAQAGFEAQLQQCREHVVHWLIPEGLGGLAAIAARWGDSERAAQLLGAASAQGPVGDSEVIERLEREFFSAAHEACDEQRWSVAYEAGRQLSLGDAIELALDRAG
jgi:predicted ATPase/DNA-binding SARP family transcriptional activator